MSQTETTRREMYRKLADLKSNLTGVMVMQWFEESLETHLEALRQQQATTTEAHRQATIAGGMLCEKLDSAEEVARVLKAQVAELLRENDRLRTERSKYKQWMRSAVRQNRAERQNVKAFRDTQDELVAQIARLQRELDGRMAPEIPADDELKRFRSSVSLPKDYRCYPPQNAPQEDRAPSPGDMISYAQEYWSSQRKAGEFGAVKWIQDETGATLIFTRGEYREDLMRAVQSIEGGAQ